MFEFFEIVTEFFNSIGNAFNDAWATMDYLYTLPGQAYDAVLSVAVLFPSYVWGPIMSLISLLIILRVLSLLNYLPLW